MYDLRHALIAALRAYLLHARTPVEKFKIEHLIKVLEGE